jgi:hypothetical protein
MRSKAWTRGFSVASCTVAALCLLAAAPLRAADRWVPVGPEGGTVVGLGFDAAGEQTLYAALADAGVFRSDDGGAGWASASAGLGFGVLRCLAVDPATPGTLYVGRGGDGIWKSTDGGRGWHSVAATWGGAPADVRSLLIDPASHALFAGLAELANPSSQAPLWRSDDGGGHWAAVDLGTNTLQVNALAAGGGFLYAGVASFVSPAGVYRSADGGASWSLSPLGDVKGLAIGGGKVWATTSAGLQVSANQGVSWTVLLAPPPVIPGRPSGALFLGAVAVDPANPSILYVAFSARAGLSPFVNGLFRSTDGGVSLAAIAGFPDALPEAVVVAASGTGRVYAAPSALGVWSSAGGAGGWAPRNAGLRVAPVYRILADPLRPAILYAAVGGVGLMRTLDGGASWRPMAADGRVFAPLALDPQRPATLYAAGGDAFGTTFLFKSTTGARRWDALAPGFGAFTDLALDPRRPRNLYAGLDLQFGSVARSADGGATWTAAGIGCTSPRHLAVSTTGEVYVGGASHCGRAAEIEGGVDRSDDGGRTFVNKRQGLPGVPVTLALAVDPARPATVYVGVRGFAVTPGGFTSFFGVFRTRDRAEHWERIEGLTDLTAPATDFAFAPAGGNAIFLASDGQGIWRSGDAGESWRALAAPGLPTARVFDLEFDRRTPATLYAATPAGLYRLDHE